MAAYQAGVLIQKYVLTNSSMHIYKQAFFAPKRGSISQGAFLNLIVWMYDTQYIYAYSFVPQTNQWKWVLIVDSKECIGW